MTTDHLSTSPPERKSRAYPVPDLSLEASIFCIWHDMEMHELVDRRRRDPALMILRRKFYYMMLDVPVSQTWLDRLAHDTAIKTRPETYPLLCISRAMGCDHTTVLYEARAYARHNDLTMRGTLPKGKKDHRPTWWREENVSA